MLEWVLLKMNTPVSVLSEIFKSCKWSGVCLLRAQYHTNTRGYHMMVQWNEPNNGSVLNPVCYIDFKWNCLRFSNHKVTQSTMSLRIISEGIKPGCIVNVLKQWRFRDNDAQSRHILHILQNALIHTVRAMLIRLIFQSLSLRGGGA